MLEQARAHKELNAFITSEEEAVLGANVVSPGDRLETAVFAITGPTSAVPANFLWFREAKVEFFR